MTSIAPLPAVILEPLVKMALAEDLGRSGDITSNSTVPAETRSKVVIASREEGRIAGLDLAELAFKTVDPTLTVKRLKPEGSDVKKGDEVMEIEGRARSILTAERVALNFVGRMSGIATLTLKMVRAVGNHKARIAATRKTTPGLRAIEKYAVQVGGGIPHRYGLDDAVLIKDNHIAMAGGVKVAIRGAKQNIGHTVKIEVEVDTLAQLKEVLEEGVDIVMLDNMSLEDMAAAVKMVAGRAVIEASGGVTLDRIPKIAATGVDLISSGAITHSAPNFDVGLDFKAAA
ncbi:MAG: carboxylating nicotinate-nucleotide diphosphorylase [Alphaproteobacteria bacterium]|nr:MAG: carboxylating nicotinate-nucleotide diphosphorylase [Alphaproteobacteria bacterium]